MNRRKLLLATLAIIAVTSILQGAIKAHANTPPPWTVSLDAHSTSPTDATIDTTYNPTGFVNIGVIINASSTHPVNNVYAWQFGLVYDNTTSKPAGATARASIQLGAQTGAGNPNWAGQVSANNAILAANILDVDATHQEVYAGFTLIGSNPGFTLGPVLSASVQGNLLASVNFTIIQTTTSTFNLKPSDLIFLDSSPSHGQIPNINAGAGATENQVIQPEFTFTISRNSISLAEGLRGTVNATVSGFHQFSGNITLDITGPSSGPSITPTPRTVQIGQGASATFSLNITTSGITPENYTFTITAVGQPSNGAMITHTLTLFVIVSPSSGSSTLLIVIISVVVVVAMVAAITYLARRRKGPTSVKQPPQKTVQKNTPPASPKRRSWKNDNLNYHD
jgi:hypothetical protein